ncbi:glutamyl-tRNA(Gln) amidotransferase subunit B, mitochondrial [Puccinia sorghi]|uniref:Glutamyl-tRNA(Gln) amidotransferase subunit B, mitochondrial n=1 Tax=Puccinia sorghi TaxID=27349 RepID=A0A0L6VRT0_9BASI|nr:glutamyl-tRNA(Gln) amidotransferase subunit B, mitochondrial [Puccinia sorghi]
MLTISPAGLTQLNQLDVTDRVGMLKNFLARCRSRRPIAIDSRIGSSGCPSVRRVSTSNILDSISERRTSSSHARFLEGAGQTNCSRSQWTTTDRDPVPAIGLELHVQLASDSKLFSSASPPSPDQQSNTNVALFDAATPGTQPVGLHFALLSTSSNELLNDVLPSSLIQLLSSDCLRLALVASLALECKINPKTSFDRKHYFYPDLPAGYQITQHYSPIATRGKIIISPDDGADRTFEVRITQIQLEQVSNIQFVHHVVHILAKIYPSFLAIEDTGKSSTDPLCPNQTLIDLNRSGVALIEIVTGPDLRTAKEASIFVRKLQSILRFAGVTKGNMEQGSLRCDLNVSVSLPDSSFQGSRCEVKNVNGFGHIEHAIDFEISRQTALLAQCQRIEMETRGFDVAQRQTFRLRDKETQTDYRYLPDPDIPPIIFPPTVLDRLQKLVPELPQAMARRLQESYGLSRTTAEVLMMLGSERIDDLADVGGGVRYFEAAMKESSSQVEGPTMANWIIHDLLGLLSKAGLRFVECPIRPDEFSELVRSVFKGSLLSSRILTLAYSLGPVAREILCEKIGNPHISLGQQIQDRISDDKDAEPDPKLAAQKLAKEIIADMPKETQLIRNGHPQIIAKLVGEGMRRSRKTVDPRLLRKAFEACLLPPTSGESAKDH